MGDVQLTKEVLEEVLDRKLQSLYATISELHRSMEFINFKYEQIRSDLELTNKEMEKTKTENKMLKNEELNLRNQVNNQQNVIHDMEEDSRRECQESLTKRNSELFNKAMAIKKSLDYKLISTTNGKVFLRKDRDSQPKLLTTVSDHDNLH